MVKVRYLNTLWAAKSKAFDIRLIASGFYWENKHKEG